ncbi:MAG: glycosyltransferase [Opitutales bacterium]|nr:glycosyltransferase [Opitutales bacterium]
MSRTLVIDPDPSGHRAFYLALIADALGIERIQLMVPGGHQHLCDCFARRGMDLNEFTIIPTDSHDNQTLITEAAKISKERLCSNVLFAYLDGCIGELLSHEGQFSCSVSGIWFHPYALDPIYRWLPPVDKRSRHRRLIHHALRRQSSRLKIGHLFFLDPAATKRISKVNPTIQATTLPDPWEKLPELDQREARSRFDLPREKFIFLHIGSSEKRKGLGDALRAFQQVAADPAISKRILLLRVGENKRLGKTARILLDELTAQKMVQRVDEFVSEADFMEYFSAADWVLLPYRKFRYSSGIFANAIAADKPMIASDYGMIGKNVRENRCGLLFRHQSINDLARTIRLALDSDPPTIDPSIRDRWHPNRFIAELRSALLTQ